MAAQAEAQSAGDNQMFAGVQISPHSLLDEGVAECLDWLQGEAAINTLLCYSHTYHLGDGTPVEVLADHGHPLRGPDERNLPRRWVRYDSAAFANSTLGHQALDGSHEYDGRDAFAEILDAAHERGMSVHARMLEASSEARKFIPNYEEVATVRIDGRRGNGPCWNHPAYVEWLVTTTEQLFKHYPLDGFQYGAERVGPLSKLLFRGRTPECFCSFCVDGNREKGVDAERVKAGFLEIQRLLYGIEQGDPVPADGVLVTIFRTLFRYPELLAWEREWYAADEHIGREIYAAVKRHAPQAKFGRHIDHQRSSWDPLYRAAIDYGQIAKHCDYIKPILYHDILGPRMRWWVVEEMSTRALRDFSRQQALEVLYATLGLDRAAEPSLDQLEEKGLSPDYVFRETRRCVQGANKAAHVYSGIGLDVPWHRRVGGMEPVHSDPETLILACERAIAAGASGLVASREYDEMRFSSLRAFGQAVRTLNEQAVANSKLLSIAEDG